MEQYRIQQIAKSYPSFKPEIVAYGDQILYEMEMDLKAMVQAISYLSEYIEYRKSIRDTHTFGDNTCNQALELLIKRVSIYSCPNNKRNSLKQKLTVRLKRIVNVCRMSHSIAYNVLQIPEGGLNSNNFQISTK